MTDVPQRLSAALADRYAIERELGAGGMATVYLAQDLKHRRQVALKVMRPELAPAAERFLREITIAANLQHPNILAMYDSGEAGGFLYYVMPYVEGESLRERLARHGEMAVGETVRILRDVADALAAAHAKGVVHRDIKPENIMLSGRHALVADFGVAKAVSEATDRRTLTTAGVALGTPAYMAPEQGAADPHLDHRADLYAFGVVAYEMVAGRPPFEGDSAQAVLLGHLMQAPTPVSEVREKLPLSLAQLIMRCLEKKPADRPQSAEEILGVLEALTTPTGGTTPLETQPVKAARRRRVNPVATVMGVAGLIAVAVVGSRLLRARPLTITVSDITPVTSEPGVEFQPAISPDGKEVAYVAGPITLPRLFVRSAVNAAGSGAVRLADTGGNREWLPRWTADGEFVRFMGCRGGLDGDCRLREVGRLGGAVRTVSIPPNAEGIRWSPDGSRVAFTRLDTILTSAEGDSATRVVVVHTAQFWYLHSLTWSPDGRWIAYVNGNAEWQFSGNVAKSSIWLVAADGGTPREVASAEFANVGPVWLDARHLLFISNRDGPRGVYVIEVGRDGPRGLPRAVPGIPDPHSLSYSPASGRLAWARLTLRQNIRAYPLGRPAPISTRDGRPVTAGSQVIEMHDVSADGQWIAYDGNLRGTMDLYRIPAGGGEAVRLTDLPSEEYAPRWSPDGREVAFHETVPSTVTRIMTVPSDGGTPVTVTDSPGWDNYPSWSPTGLSLVFGSDRSGTWTSWVLSRDSAGGTWRDAVPLDDLRCDGSPSWAPDGSGVMCLRGDSLVLVSPSGRVLSRRAVPALTRLTLGALRRVSRDGRTCYAAGVHQDGRRGIWAVPLLGGEARLVVAYDDPALVPFEWGISVGPEYLYLTIAEYESDIWVATLNY